MKLRILLLITPLLTLSVSLFAKPVLDSVGIENLDGKKVILHKLDPKDNYYSIGRRYNVKPAVIIQFNNNAALKIGDIIKVPTDRPFLEDTKPAVTHPAYTAPRPAAQPTGSNNVNAGVTPQQYKVSAGETLYSIAKRFNSTVDNIMKLNGLTSSTVVPGQIIQVRSNVTDTPPPVVRPVATRDSLPIGATQDSSNAERRMNANRLGLFEKSEKGVASWSDDPGLDPNKKLVLHRTAPVGTVIKITNPMTNLSTFAKVIGSFADNETNKDVILIMTKSVAESIGALDKRVHVNISYGSPNE
jgi:LysM repeat protein